MDFKSFFRRKERERLLDHRAFLAELTSDQREVKEREEQCMRALHLSLKQRDKHSSEEWFQLVLEWNHFHQTLQHWKEAINTDQRHLYVGEAWFLADLVRYLTPGPDEEATYVTGAKIGNLKILSRVSAVELQMQSPVYALGNTASCSDALERILDHGNLLHAMAHSHPGAGANATLPSEIDRDYLQRIQRAGANVIGIIVTRDGFVRFFTVERPFRVLITGNGVHNVAENVFQIALADHD